MNNGSSEHRASSVQYLLNAALVDHEAVGTHLRGRDTVDRHVIVTLHVLIYDDIDEQNGSPLILLHALAITQR